MIYFVCYKEFQGDCKVVMAMNSKELKAIRETVEKEKKDGTLVKVISIKNQAQRASEPTVELLVRMVTMLDESHDGVPWAVALEDLLSMIANATAKL